MSTVPDSEIPQWKRDLIARLRSQNKRTATVAVGKHQQLCAAPPHSSSADSSSSVQQPNPTCNSEPVAAAEQCNAPPSHSDTMVQDRGPWDSLAGKLDAEDLKYGPGIVSKLKSRFQSLAQRETVRPSILRKAASLEDLLDEAPPPRLFQSHAKAAPNRYRTKTRGQETMKRAHSLEAISRTEEPHHAKPKRESYHEEMLINEGNKAATEVPPMSPEVKTYNRVNRPKRIAPLMNEKEKPPVDVVKQAKLIFERHSKTAISPKIANTANMITQNRKKPPILAKPKVLKTNGVTKPKPEEKRKGSLPSPIPDISRVEFASGEGERGSKNTSLSETPDLIMTSSPILSAPNSPAFRISATENFIKEEILHASATIKEHNRPVVLSPKKVDEEGFKWVSSQTLSNINKDSATMTFNFAAKNGNGPLSPVNKNVLNTHTPPSQVLKLEVNGGAEAKSPKCASPVIVSPPQPKPAVANNRQVSSPKQSLTSLEIEKNFINSAKKSEPVTNHVKVNKAREAPRDSGNSMVFKFTDRKDVPDYVQNDGMSRVSKPEKPKVGEGGIILLAGASLGESFTDEEDEISLVCEAPPSPCDVTFINDNVLIDGKSSLSQKSRKTRMNISFVEAVPEIFEYPSESSLLVEDPQRSPQGAQLGHTVPSMSGTSSLANYIPRSSTEDFHPGVTRSLPNIPNDPISEDTTDGNSLHEAEYPIQFSAGTNADILF